MSIFQSAALLYGEALESSELPILFTFGASMNNKKIPTQRRNKGYRTPPMQAAIDMLATLPQATRQESAQAYATAALACGVKASSLRAVVRGSAPTIQDAVLAQFSLEGTCVSDVIAALPGRKEDTIRTVIFRLHKAGKLIKVRIGKYRLAAAG